MQRLPDGPPKGAFPVHFPRGATYQGEPIIAAWIEPFVLQSGSGGAALMIRTPEDLDVAGSLDWKGAPLSKLKPEAKITVEALASRVGVPDLGAAVVQEAELPRNLRRRGLGAQMYEAAAASAARDRRALLSAEFAVEGGSTNTTARRIWSNITRVLLAWPGRAAVVHVAALPASSRDLWVKPYVSPRQRALSWTEQRVRNIAYKMKGNKLTKAHDTAGRAMADLLRRAGYRAPVLVPIPSSSGSTTANRFVCEAMVDALGRGVVLDALERSKPVESSHKRRQAGKPGLKARAHKLKWTGPEVDLGNVVFVDNVITTGATMGAARRALGGGRGVAWAKADEVLTKAAR